VRPDQPFTPLLIGTSFFLLNQVVERAWLFG
jgi:hypothetical protein